jgi:hypothetical protein
MAAFDVATLIAGASSRLMLGTPFLKADPKEHSGRLDLDSHAALTAARQPTLVGIMRRNDVRLALRR